MSFEQENLFDRLNNRINDVEGSIVNFLTAFAPWLAPVPPAVMTYKHMVSFLEFEPIVGLVVAAVVEILGFGTVSTGLDFWFNNRVNKAKVKQAPLGLVFVIFLFYLALVLVSNVIIDVAKQFWSEDGFQVAIIVVRGLLTLQTIPGALIVAVRTSHRELLRELKAERSGNFPETFRNNDEKRLGDWRLLRPTLDIEGLEVIASLDAQGVKDLAKQYGVDPRTVRDWRMYAAEELDAMYQAQES